MKILFLNIMFLLTISLYSAGNNENYFWNRFHHDFNYYFDKTDFESLLDSINKDDPITLRALLKAKSNINSTGRDNVTLLNWAIGSGKYRVVEELFILGADSNIGSVQGIAPLEVAIFLNDINMVNLMAKYGVNLNVTLGEHPLVQSFIHSDMLMTKTLLDLGSDPNFVKSQGNPLVEAWVTGKDDELILLLMEKGASPRVSDYVTSIFQESIKKMRYIPKTKQTATYQKLREFFVQYGFISNIDDYSNMEVQH